MSSEKYPPPLLAAAARVLEDCRQQAGWSVPRLVVWLSTPHADFEGVPAAALRSEPAAVVAALQRAVELPVHG